MMMKMWIVMLMLFKAMPEWMVNTKASIVRKVMQRATRVSMNNTALFGHWVLAVSR
jgi:hypothetical protein